MRERKDFVQIRLSEAGREHAGSGETLRVATMHMHYVFVGEEPVEVLRSEWKVLQHDCDAEGQALLEEVPAAEAAAEETHA